MMESMTGFAERSFSSPTLRAKISLKSLNHRYLDWSYKGAPLGKLENRLRAACQKSIRRGRVEASLDMTFLDPAGWELFINQPLLAKLLDALKKAAGRRHSEVRFAVDNVFHIPNVVDLRHKGLRRKEAELLARAFESTLADLVRARRREGRAIESQLRSQVRTIRRSLGRIERRFRAQRGRLREKLRQRLREVPNTAPLSEERLTQETALLVQRCDITEEIVRLKSHLEAVGDWLSSRKKAGSPGRMLDFLSQEILREANTINSKSQDLTITRECLTLKGEVEAIRQQVQNLE
jgi:uncharacterized protein (TIGR00255 family)